MSFQTEILKVDQNSIHFVEGQELPEITDVETKTNLLRASEILTKTKDVIGFPTETVYGLGGSALDDESVKSIYRAKNRPADNPLIVHISSIEQLKRKILPVGFELPEIYTELLNKFWPGPLSILLPVLPNSPISQYVTAGQSTFAVRMPAHPVARALIAISDTPLAAPSANASTKPSPTLASHVYTDLNGKIPYILDGGLCNVGVESTVIDGLCDPPMLLRPGGVSVEELRRVGGGKWKDVVLAKKTAGKLEPVRTPGMKYRHYSPKAKVVLFVNCSDGKKAVHTYLTTNDIKSINIALLKSKYFASSKEISSQIAVERDLGHSGQEISQNLFRWMREVDELGVDLILIEGVDESAEGLAIMNRLTKAAVETIDGTQ